MLKLSKDGVLFFRDSATLEWTQCDEEDVVEIVNQYYDEPCLIEEGTTLGDLFKFLDNNEDIIPIILEDEVYDFLEEMRQDQDDDTRNEKVEYIEFSWNVEESDGFLYEDISVDGWCKKPEGAPDVTAKDKDGNIPCGIGFYPVNTMKNTPVKINHEYVITKDEDPIDSYVNATAEELMERARNKVDGEVLFQSQKYFTISLLFGSLFYEVSFYGAPEQRDAFRENLFTIAEQAEEGVFQVYSNEHVQDIAFDASFTKEEREAYNQENEKEDKDEESALKEVEDLLGDIDEDV